MLFINVLSSNLLLCANTLKQSPKEEVGFDSDFIPVLLINLFPEPSNEFVTNSVDFSVKSTIRLAVLLINVEFIKAEFSPLKR